FQTPLFAPSSPPGPAIKMDWQRRCAVCLFPHLQTHPLARLRRRRAFRPFPSERREMRFDTRTMTIHPFAEMNFDYQIIVHSEGLTERILRNLQAPIQITSEHRSKVERDRERQVTPLEQRHIKKRVLV